MQSITRNDFFLGRAKIITEFREENTQEQLEHHIAQFFRIVRKREDLYVKLLQTIRRNPLEQSTVQYELNSTIMVLEDSNQKIRTCRHAEMSLIDRKTMVYHFCTKLVELLDGLKERVKAEKGPADLVEHEKQQILKRYKGQLNTGDFDLHDLSNIMAGFPRPLGATYQPPKKAVQPNGRFEEPPGSNFVRSTQLLSNRQRQHLIKFVRLKQKEQQRKAKLEQQNNTDMKIIRKKARRLYKMMECEELVTEQFSPTLTREQNVQELVVMQLARNAVVQQQIQDYRERYAEKSPDSRSCVFRIKKKMTAPAYQRKSTTLQTLEK